MIPVRHRTATLLSPGMLALLVAQFFSALADNTILIVAIASLKFAGLSAHIPLLQASFVLPFIVLAPCTGPISDRHAKGRVMLAANLLKLAGALAMAAGAHPLASYALIGIGAAVYSPAKYGILAQMFDQTLLVRANGMMESSTIVAILLGVILGGWLADQSLRAAFGGVLVAYIIAAGANLFVPVLPAERAGGSWHPRFLLGRYAAILSQVLKDPDMRFSLFGTSVFWGSGATLRVLLFAWVPAALLIADNQTPANLMGGVSVGIVLGAAAAGMWITLANVNRALIGGMLLGPAIIALAFVHDLPLAYVLMICVGLCGGLFVVPLNALLQQRGHGGVGAGNALAVQNFMENIAMLVGVAAYGLAADTIPVATTAEAFGVALLFTVGGLAVARLRQAAP